MEFFSNKTTLFTVHDLNRFTDNIQGERGHCFGQDSCGARLISVLSFSEKKTDKVKKLVKLVMLTRQVNEKVD